MSRDTRTEYVDGAPRRFPEWLYLLPDGLGEPPPHKKGQGSVHPDGTPRWQPHMGPCYEDVYEFNGDEAVRSQAPHPAPPVPTRINALEDLDRSGL